jgi:aminopeptidase N
MENTTATVFSDGYVIDSIAFVDKNYVNVNAHELAHQWFGNLVTEKDGNHHWLHEGFATYYAYLAERHLFGDDHFYWKLYKSLKELEERSKRGEDQSLLDPKASSLTFYEKGAWALFALQNKVGDKAFKKGIQKYLKKYQFKNVTVDDFLMEMEGASTMNLSGYREDWLVNTSLPFEKATKALVEAAPSLKLLAEMEAESQRTQNNDNDHEKYWDTTNSIHLKKHIIEQYHSTLSHEVFVKAFACDTLPIRQELAIRFDSVPVFLKSRFESLLDDKSYVTVENALLKLWMNYPGEKAKYLERTKAIHGLPNKNVRLLWLILAISTNDYDTRNTQAYFNELSDYTSPKYSWEVSIGAFQYLREIGFNDQSLKNLINAAIHHSWQFKKFARNLIDELLKDADYKNRINELSEELKDAELRYIKTKLN